MSAAATVIAIVAMTVALPLLWLRADVVDPRRFSATAAELGATDTVRTFVATMITEQIAKAAGTLTGSLAKPLAQRYTRSPAFIGDFVDLVDQQHAWLFDPPAADVDPTVMRLDLTRMVRRVARQVAPMLGDQIGGPIRLPVTQRSAALHAGRYQRAAAAVSRWGIVALGIAVVAAVVALASSASRGTTLVWLGLGMVLAAGVAWSLGAALVSRIRGSTAGIDAGAREVVDSTVGALAVQLNRWSRTVAGLGAAVVVLGVVVRLLWG